MIPLPNSFDNVDRILALVERLYAIVAQLEELFPGKRFTPDGHMVGSLGEVLAAYRYDPELLPNSTKDHDGRSRDGRQVQVKSTQGTSSVTLISEPEHLVVLRLNKDGAAEEVFNGPGSLAWGNTNARRRDRHYPIPINRLPVINA